MTAVGKILVFLNLVFSVLTAGLIVMVFVTRTNWKNAYDDAKNKAMIADAAYKVAVSERDDVIKKSSEQIDELKREITSQKQLVVAKEKELTEARDLLKKVELAANSADVNSTLAREELDRTRQERKQLDDEKRLRLSEIAALRKSLDEQRQLAVANEIAWKSTQGKLEKLLDRYEQVVAENKELRFQTNAGGGTATVSNQTRTLASPGPNAAPANVRGTVIAFANGLTSVSVGTDSGVIQGTQLDVYRLDSSNPAASKYLGKLLIREAKPKEAVGQFYAATKDVPQQGDQVGTIAR